MQRVSHSHSFLFRLYGLLFSVLFAGPKNQPNLDILRNYLYWSARSGRSAINACRPKDLSFSDVVSTYYCHGQFMQLRRGSILQLLMLFKREMSII